VHELSLAQALVEQVDALVAQYRAQRAILIHLRVGPLAGVVPELLAEAFPLAAAGSAAATAQLAFTPSPLRVRCLNCGGEGEASPNHLVCAQCGDWHTQVISGDELLLESVELEGVD